MALLKDILVHWPATFLSGLVIAGIACVIYRLTLHPLAKFPGPRLAGATYLYEGYYDLVKGGKYVFKIKELHEKYGPIVRISPNHLHINDPDYYNTVYSSTSPRNKWGFAINFLLKPLSTVFTIDHRTHQMRRQALNPFFSKQSIFKLEPVLSSMVEKLCRRLTEFQHSGNAIDIRYAYCALTTDIITLYALNRSFDYLDEPDFSGDWYEAFRVSSKMLLVARHFPWLLYLEALPDWMCRLADPNILLMKKLEANITEQISDVFRRQEEGGKADYGTLDRSIFDVILNGKLPPQEKTFQRLRQEGITLIGAGVDTTANALSQITFHLLNNPEKLAKLREELFNAIPDPTQPLDLRTVEQLPYLGAVINEGLRISYGAPARLPRIAPNETLQFREWAIPPGTPISMSSVFIHDNESIFPEPRSFVPERWIGNGRALDKYMVAFTKGSRQCIAMNLAKAELYLTLAAVFRRFHLQLFDTYKERDIDFSHDYYMPSVSNNTKGIRVTVTSK